MNTNAGEDTLFKVKKFLNCRGRILDLSTPAIMGIINLTPDSFFDGGTINNEKDALSFAEKMLNSGADILDIGGQSTRPRSKRISPIEEWERIFPSLKKIVKEFPNAIISVDTFYSEVAMKALEEGASIINDVSAGEIDKEMLNLIPTRNVPYVLMHMQGNPENMQDNPQYDDVVKEVLEFFVSKITELRKLNINDIIIDPGFGFGKSVEHNYSLLNNLELFRIFDCPVLAGLSRKSMLTKVLNIKPAEALNGTTALNTIALLKGASILRVHDVAEAVQVKKIFERLRS